MAGLKKLNLGCGHHRVEGFIGVDNAPGEAVDVVADIEESLPFEDACADEILLQNVIEHVDDIPKLMKEIHRVSANGAKLRIVTPHYSAIDSWTDPTHKHHLSYHSMDMFANDSVSYYIGGGFKIIERSLSFGGYMGLIGKMIFAISPREYEKRWAFIFRGNLLRWTLEARKD